MKHSKLRQAILDELNLICGSKCWHVNVGGFSDHTFSLHVGSKMKRKQPLREGWDSDFRYFSGEFSLYVWSSWTISQSSVLIATSKSSVEIINQALACLIGDQVTSVHTVSNSWLVRLEFVSGKKLEIEPFDALDDGAFDEMWEFSTPEFDLAFNTKGGIALDPRSDFTDEGKHLDEKGDGGKF